MSEVPSSAALGAATALQTTASDPELSVWVSANAGSGKTHVLARRVIRLLMRGVQPGRILCLTYTKAAAANMANRVLGELRKWARLDDEALDRAIDAADGPCLPGSRSRPAVALRVSPHAQTILQHSHSSRAPRSTVRGGGMDF